MTSTVAAAIMPLKTYHTTNTVESKVKSHLHHYNIETFKLALNIDKILHCMCSCTH